jgi:polyphosphate kinase 2 (PPK2 family)
MRERSYWPQYRDAYERCIEATARRHAPWYIIPADDKANARLIVSRIILDTLTALDLRYPKTTPARRRELKAIRKELSK